MTARYLCAALALSFAAVAAAAPSPEREWKYKSEFWPELVRAVPGMLRSQDPRTGRFGTGVFIVLDQHPIYPLAVAWAIPHPSNPYYHRAEVLEAVMAGGDALIDDQDAKGMWVFRKKDNSTWGMIYQPWTYTRWIRAFGLVRDGMPAARRARWEKALTLGYEGISKTALDRIHNIPAHHAMGLYEAGKLLGRPEWCRQAQEFLRKICASQDPRGFWPEHGGPAVSYNFVYSEAAGIYYAMSKDDAVLPALNRAAAFHAVFTYPDGTRVETIDGRNPYHPGIRLGNPGFTFSPEGRTHVLRQWRRLLASGGSLDADEAASFILYGEEGPVAEPVSQPAEFRSVLGKNDAVVEQRGPWFVCLSAIHLPVPQSRWGQDRQNLASVFHEKTGLIVGGGNSKMQPLWSTFSIGDLARWVPKVSATEEPDFNPPAGVVHVPSDAKLVPERDALELNYGGQACRVEVDISNPGTARLVYTVPGADGARPAEAHATLLPHLGEKWTTATGRTGTLGDKPFRLGPGEAGAWFAHHGWRISLPREASVIWPALPYDPYKKDGASTAEQGLIVVALPFSEAVRKQELAVEILK